VKTTAFAGPVLVDQGEADKFLEIQLQPERLVAASEDSGVRVQLRRHPGYDHSYWFIQSVVADHLRHHARGLGLGRRGEPAGPTP
jgi:S-formylglutathione hydrolase